MKKLELNEIKKIGLDILIYIDGFCKKNNIEYFINYGTLLGAVRHKGFIPWDDDIDITMTRENYNKFIKLFKNDTSKYKILSLESEKNYFNNFIKIHNSETKIIYSDLTKSYDSGIFIDIFPLDYFDNKKVINISYFFESLKYLSFIKKENVTYKDSKIKDLCRIIMWYLVRPIHPKFFAKVIEKIIKKYTSNKPTFSAFIISKNKEKDILPLNTGRELIELEFENHKFPAPKNYDEVLTYLYNDYMKLPKKSEQVPHKFYAYYTDKKNSN
ncbi:MULTISPECIES: phosphorylcholine transferase LicD [unclassified Gemella]|uniref:LicD family protein n=1 Tax=unclassified Gemella TaxID=2624949 RepID=UPI001C04F6A8|nr:MULTISPECIES: LicD family protein [unclassified Gemella]MBU0279235.1 LicD family protein [Gemella sp. zg-1178]QWQ39043.1 LicD family protein [Gemella sp. zg-570]